MTTRRWTALAITAAALWLVATSVLVARSTRVCPGTLARATLSGRTIDHLVLLDAKAVELERESTTGYMDTQDVRARYSMGPFFFHYFSSSYHGRPGAQPIQIEEPGSCDGGVLTLDLTPYFEPTQATLWGDSTRGIYTFGAAVGGGATVRSPNGFHRRTPTRYRSLPRYASRLWMALGAGVLGVSAALFGRRARPPEVGGRARNIWIALAGLGLLALVGVTISALRG